MSLKNFYRIFLAGVIWGLNLIPKAETSFGYSILIAKEVSNQTTPHNPIKIKQ